MESLRFDVKVDLEVGQVCVFVCHVALTRPN